jgi:hypothetical protein
MRNISWNSRQPKSYATLPTPIWVISIFNLILSTCILFRYLSDLSDSLNFCNIFKFYVFIMLNLSGVPFNFNHENQNINHINVQ